MTETLTYYDHSEQIWAAGGPVNKDAVVHAIEFRSSKNEIMSSLLWVFENLASHPKRNNIHEMIKSVEKVLSQCLEAHVIARPHDLARSLAKHITERRQSDLLVHTHVTGSKRDVNRFTDFLEDIK